MTGAVLEQYYKKSTEQVILDKLLEWEGIPLSIDDLSDETKYNTTTVREALRHLHKRGVIHSRDEYRGRYKVVTYWTGWLKL